MRYLSRRAWQMILDDFTRDTAIIYTNRGFWGVGKSFGAIDYLHYGYFSKQLNPDTNNKRRP